jgi:hypothetical protein
MDTILDKSWLNALNTNSSNKINEDFLYNSLLGLLGKQHGTSTNDNNDTIDSNEFIFDRYSEPQKQSFLLPAISPPYLILESKSYFTGAQKWIGHVTSISKHTFKAQLNDLNNPTTYEVGEFELNEIPPQDMELLSLGAAFYWSVGQANMNGQVEKKSLIRFQRMKPWSVTDYDNALDKADLLFNELNWD